MRRIIKISVFATLLSMGSHFTAYAGNSDRAGQAGAGELLINPWTRSAGWMGCYGAGVKGLESQYLNVAGTAFTKKTEIIFNHTQWLKGTDIDINSFGLSQRVGESGALSLSIMSMTFGDIDVTTPESPEGNIGTFSPRFLNVALSYAKAFSNSIYGGVTVKIISESIDQVKSSGFAFDAGIQYVTGFNKEKDNLHFGISLKNVGAPMQFRGDGLNFKGYTSDQLNSGNTGAQQVLTVSQRSDRVELPSLVNISGAYDFKFMELHRVTVAAAFTSNSFTKDNTAIGLEYGFKKLFMVRAGYQFEKDGSDKETSTNVYSGFGFGASVEAPFGKGGKAIGLDYSYRPTITFDGTHSFGLILKL